MNDEPFLNVIKHSEQGSTHHLLPTKSSTPLSQCTTSNPHNNVYSAKGMAWYVEQNECKHEEHLQVFQEAQAIVNILQAQTLNQTKFDMNFQITFGQVRDHQFWNSLEECTITTKNKIERKTFTRLSIH